MISREEELLKMTISLCQDHARKTIRTVRAAMRVVDAFLNGASKKKLDLEFQNVLNEREKVIQMKNDIARHLSSALLLMQKEDFYRLISSLSEIADYAVGIAHRIKEMNDMKCKVPKKVRESLSELGTNSLRTVDRVKNMMHALLSDRESLEREQKRISTMENKVDELYRNFDLLVMKSKLDLPSLLLLRDIGWLMESVADKAEDIADILRILGFVLL